MKERFAMAEEICAENGGRCVEGRGRCVERGCAVGDMLVILESMKMEHPGAGRVGRAIWPSWPSTRATWSRKAY